MSKRLPLTLNSERLTLKLVELDDAPMIHATLNTSFDALAPWMPWLKRGQTVDDRVDFCRRAIEDFKVEKSATYAIMTSGQKLAGVIDARAIDWAIPSAEIGYWGSSEFKGQGYISGAVRLLSDALITRFSFERIWLTCDAMNANSARVAERSKFTLEARLKHARRNNQGQLSDTLIFAKTRQE